MHVIKDQAGVRHHGLGCLQGRLQIIEFEPRTFRLGVKHPNLYPAPQAYVDRADTTEQYLAVMTGVPGLMVTMTRAMAVLR